MSTYKKLQLERDLFDEYGNFSGQETIGLYDTYAEAIEAAEELGLSADECNIHSLNTKYFY